MSDENDEKFEVNETVKAMGDTFRSDVPVGLMTIPAGTSPSALAKRIAGEIAQNECLFVCLNCGWEKSLQFAPDEIAALGDIREYTGPCPQCGCSLLQPKDKLWGDDFSSMTSLAQKNKRAEARVNAEEFVDVVKQELGNMVGIPRPTIEDPELAKKDEESSDEEPDISNLTPR